MSKLVVFGPWVGEFSYEFSWWVPEIRELRNNQYAEYDAFHVGYKGRRGLYKDFIDKYISYPDEVGDTITRESINPAFKFVAFLCLFLLLYLNY